MVKVISGKLGPVYVRLARLYVNICYQQLASRAGGNVVVDSSMACRGEYSRARVPVLEIVICTGMLSEIH